MSDERVSWMDSVEGRLKSIEDKVDKTYRMVDLLATFIYLAALPVGILILMTFFK